MNTFCYMYVFYSGCVRTCIYKCYVLDNQIKMIELKKIKVDLWKCNSPLKIDRLQKICAHKIPGCNTGLLVSTSGGGAGRKHVMAGSSKQRIYIFSNVTGLQKAEKGAGAGGTVFVKIWGLKANYSAYFM